MKTQGFTPAELRAWFVRLQDWLEPAYLAGTEPWQQSGMSGPEERWVALRKPVADCISRSGSFLDVGCANGYLLECCLKWTAERGIAIAPYGLDISAKLVALAQERLPQYADHFFIGNAFYWSPPKRFDFIRAELVYVPAEYERAYVEHLVNDCLESDGNLLVANYAEEHPHPEKGILPGSHPTKHLLDRLADLNIRPQGYEDCYDPVKGRSVRVAILTRQSFA